MSHRIYTVTVVTSIIAWLVFVSPVASHVPTTMNYQGLLTDGLGSPVVDGDYPVTFTIYDADVGGNSKWTETQVISTTDGLFSVLLGSVNPIADSVFADSSRYLGITVNTDPEITPRTRMVSSPYAFVSSRVNGDIETSPGVIKLDAFEPAPAPPVDVPAGPYILISDDILGQLFYSMAESGKLETGCTGCGSSGGDRLSEYLPDGILFIDGDDTASIKNNSGSIDISPSPLSDGLSLGGFVTFAPSRVISVIGGTQTFEEDPANGDYLSLTNTNVLVTSFSGNITELNSNGLMTSSSDGGAGTTDSFFVQVGGGTVLQNSSSSDDAGNQVINMMKIDVTEPSFTEHIGLISSTGQTWSVEDFEPSGNREWETLRINAVGDTTQRIGIKLDATVPSLPAGFYHWEIGGNETRMSTDGLESRDGSTWSSKVGGNSTSGGSVRLEKIGADDVQLTPLEGLIFTDGISTDSTKYVPKKVEMSSSNGSDTSNTVITPNNIKVSNLGSSGEDGVSIDVNIGGQSSFRMGNLTSGTDGISASYNAIGSSLQLGGGGGAGGSLFLEVGNAPQSGKIGVNNLTPFWEVDVTGTICATGGMCGPSDIRYKKNVETITEALKTITNLRGVKFDWRSKEFPNKQFNNKHQVGFIAQEVIEILPQVVMEDDNGYLSVDYSKLTPLLVEAVKEQQATIDQIKQKNADLENRIVKLEKLLQSWSLKTDSEE